MGDSAVVAHSSAAMHAAFLQHASTTRESPAGGRPAPKAPVSILLLEMDGSRRLVGFRGGSVPLAFGRIRRVGPSAVGVPE